MWLMPAEQLEQAAMGRVKGVQDDLGIFE